MAGFSAAPASHGCRLLRAGPPSQCSTWHSAGRVAAASTLELPYSENKEGWGGKGPTKRFLLFFAEAALLQLPGTTRTHMSTLAPSKRRRFQKVLCGKHVREVTGSRGTSAPCTRLGDADLPADVGSAL